MSFGLIFAPSDVLYIVFIRALNVEFVVQVTFLFPGFVNALL